MAAQTDGASIDAIRMVSGIGMSQMAAGNADRRVSLILMSVTIYLIRTYGGPEWASRLDQGMRLVIEGEAELSKWGTPQPRRSHVEYFLGPAPEEQTEEVVH